jgi:hypothetical protein
VLESSEEVKSGDFLPITKEEYLNVTLVKGLRLLRLTPNTRVMKEKFDDGKTQ